MKEKFRKFGRKISAWYGRNELVIKDVAVVVVCMGSAFITGKFIGDTVYTLGKTQGIRSGYNDMKTWLENNGYADAVDKMAIEIGKSVMGIEGPKND